MYREIPVRYAGSPRTRVYSMNPLSDVQVRQSAPLSDSGTSDLESEAEDRNASGITENASNNPAVVQEAINSDSEDSFGDEASDKEQAIQEDPSALAYLNRKLEEAHEREEGLLREFKNYRKHTENTLNHIKKQSKQELLAEMADLIHALELAGDASKYHPETISEGLKLITHQLEEVYDKYGLKRIRSVDSRFDPQLHEAVMSEEVQGYDKGEVVRELSPGFMTDDRVIRPAKVSVAK